MSAEERKLSVDGHVYRYGLVNGTRCWYTGYSCKVAVDDETERLLAALSTAEREQGANTLSADNLKWRSRIDALREFFRDSAYAAEQELQRRGAPSEDHFVRQQRSYLAWLDELRDIFFARVPSGGEEGRT